MDPVEDFFNNPKRKIGGAVVPLLGPPGSGKTNALIQLALMRKDEGHKIIWRGIKQAEWMNFLANGEEVVVWNHERFNRVRVKRSDSGGTTYRELEDIEGVEVKTWSDPETVVEDSSRHKINVVNVPGIEERNFEARKFFTRNMIDILDAIVNRENTYHFVDFFTDEAGDIWPGQQQVRGDLWQLVGVETPPLLAQLRKQNSFLYLAAHGKQDIHHFIYKVKANTIGYMQFANVVKELHPTVDSKKVNQLGRGDIIIPPWFEENFKLAEEEQSLEWVGDAEVDLEWEYDLELETEEDEEDEMGWKERAAKQLYQNDETDITQDWLAGALNTSKQVINEAVNN